MLLINKLLNNGQKYIELFKVQTKYYGYANALLSTLLNMPLHAMTSSYQKLVCLDIPVLLLWDMNDCVIPPSYAEEFKHLIPHIEYREIPDSGHFPHYENPEFVNAIL